MKTKKENKLVVGNSSWAESLPESLLNDIKTERIVLGLVAATTTLTNSEKVGDAEVIAYLMTASLAAPLPHNLTEIYCYLITKNMRQKGIDAAVYVDICKAELNSDEKRKLQELKFMIYEKRGGEIQHPLLDFMRQFKKDIHKLPKEKTLFNMD